MTLESCRNWLSGAGIGDILCLFLFLGRALGLLWVWTFPSQPNVDQFVPCWAIKGPLCTGGWGRRWPPCSVSVTGAGVGRLSGNSRSLLLMNGGEGKGISALWYFHLLVWNGPIKSVCLEHITVCAKIKPCTGLNILRYWNPEVGKNTETRSMGRYWSKASAGSASFPSKWPSHAYNFWQWRVGHSRLVFLPRYGFQDLKMVHASIWLHL